MCSLSPWSGEWLQDLGKRKKPHYIHISHGGCVYSRHVPSGLLRPTPSQAGSKGISKTQYKTKNHLYQLYLSPKLPGYWLQQPVFLMIYFPFSLQCFSWRCYSSAFLLTDRSIISKVLTEFKEITIFKTENRSSIIFPMYCLPDNSNGVRSFKNIWIWLRLLPLLPSATNVISICNFTSSVQIWLTFKG